GMGMDSDHLSGVILAALRVPLVTALLLSPILIAFALAFLKQKTRTVYISIAGAIIFFAYLWLRPHSFWVESILAPALSGVGDYLTPQGILQLPDIGNRPIILNFAVRTLITVVSYFAAFAFVVLLIRIPKTRNAATQQDQPARTSWRQLLILLGPFTLAYCCFLGIRTFAGIMLDRYLLPLLFVLALVALRFYQERVGPRLPLA